MQYYSRNCYSENVIYLKVLEVENLYQAVVKHGLIHTNYATVAACELSNVIWILMKTASSINKYNRNQSQSMILHKKVVFSFQYVKDFLLNWTWRINVRLLNAKIHFLFVIAYSKVSEIRCVRRSFRVDCTCKISTNTDALAAGHTLMRLHFEHTMCNAEFRNNVLKSEWEMMQTMHAKSQVTQIRVSGKISWNELHGIVKKASHETKYASYQLKYRNIRDNLSLSFLFFTVFTVIIIILK